MVSLFRKEVIQHQADRLWGDVLLCTPLPTRILTLFLALIVLAVALFLVFASYARKQTVHGYLRPEAGISNVYSMQQARINDVYVREDEHVDEGQPLVTLSAPHFLRDGEDSHELLLAEIDRLIAETSDQIALEKQTAGSERKRLKAQLASYRAERVRLNRQVDLLSNRTAFLRDRVEKAEALFQGSNISEVEFQRIKDELYASLLEAEQLTQLTIQADLKTEEAASALDQLPIRLELEISTLRSRQAELSLRRTELQARGSYSLRAPVSGQVSGLYVKSGESVDGNALLLSILPDESKLQAILYVPTRAIGFIDEGQHVRLYYDSFPYQRFGLHAGQVVSISSTVRTGPDLPAAAMVNEPVYSVTVDLERQFVKAFGDRHELQAGMQLRAEIVLDRRSLLEWVLEPLYSIKGHL